MITVNIEYGFTEKLKESWPHCFSEAVYRKADKPNTYECIITLKDGSQYVGDSSECGDDVVTDEQARSAALSAATHRVVSDNIEFRESSTTA